MKQILKVRTTDYDQHERGPEFRVHYILYECTSEEDFSRSKYEIFVGDGEGNNTFVAEGEHLGRMRSLVLALGEFVEWEEKQNANV